ncbi:DUF159 family protein [Lactobacillus sp. ESL0233]|uniref:SOS response-associated peptidase family protein n=1 Tax=Lactobacillus sp. ESL0233 TaxID=2069354 RepID=UPI000EFB1380|nr:SOS response-associated peptidase family protein [Lactobacillus sp. ESL0233]RMC40160.1 DUF159 family protein [Lactobacillus sp. ESL0233]
MCHQFQIPSLAEIKKYLITDLKLPLIEPDSNLPQNSNIFPQKKAPILLYQNNQLLLIPKTWGYPKPMNQNQVIFNARIERFFNQRPSMWDSSFARRRCIIVTNCFFETAQETYITKYGKQAHEEYSFHNSNEPLTLIAGIYQNDYFSMVTTTANQIMQPIHDRMPLVIEPDELRQWLFQNFSALITRDVNLVATKMAQ